MNTERRNCAERGSHDNQHRYQDYEHDRDERCRHLLLFPRIDSGDVFTEGYHSRVRNLCSIGNRGCSGYIVTYRRQTGGRQRHNQHLSVQSNASPLDYDTPTITQTYRLRLKICFQQKFPQDRESAAAAALLPGVNTNRGIAGWNNISINGGVQNGQEATTVDGVSMQEERPVSGRCCCGAGLHSVSRRLERS